MELTWVRALVAIALAPVVIALIMVAAHFMIKFVRAGRFGALLATASAVVVPLGVVYVAVTSWISP